MLQDLLLFCSSKEKKLVTLDEYVSRMPEDQKYIYYATGESIERIEKLPQTELVLDKGYEMLYFTEDIDEFAIKMLMKYKDKEFKSVSSGDLGIEADETSRTRRKRSENKELFEDMKEVLGGKVKSVKASKRLKSPSGLLVRGRRSVDRDGESAERDAEQPGRQSGQSAGSQPESRRFSRSLKNAFEHDKEKLELYTNLLYNQALLIEGLPIDDPVAFTNDMCKLMVR